MSVTKEALGYGLLFTVYLGVLFLVIGPHVMSISHQFTKPKKEKDS